MQSIALRSGVLTSLILLAAGASMAAAPTLDGITEDAVKTDIAKVTKQIDEYAKYWTDQMQNAKAEREITEARAKLVDGYSKLDNVKYRTTYADEVSKGLMALLAGGDDALKTVRQINAGRAIVQMPQTSIQGALDKMVVDANPGLRLYGWQGYRDIRPRLLEQNPDKIQRMYNKLAEQMPKETNPSILEAMMEVLNLTSLDMTAATAESRKEAQNRTFIILTRQWPTVCKTIVNGDCEAVVMARDGIAALQFCGGASKGDKPRQTAVLQGLLDMMWCAWIVYDKAAKTDFKPDDKATKAEVEMKTEAMAVLLRDGEAALAAVTDQKITVITAALAERNPLRDRSTKVGLGLLDWLNKTLKPMGVVQPTYTAEAATTAPASAPASAPK